MYFFMENLKIVQKISKFWGTRGLGYLGWLPPGVKKFWRLASVPSSQDFQRSMQCQSLDTSNSFINCLIAEIFHFKIRVYSKILKISNCNILAPRGPRHKKFGVNESLPKDHLWAKYHQNW